MKKVFRKLVKGLQNGSIVTAVIWFVAFASLLFSVAFSTVETFADGNGNPKVPMGHSITVTVKGGSKKNLTWNFKTDGKTTKVKGSKAKGSKALGKKKSGCKVKFSSYKKAVITSDKARYVKVSAKNGKKAAKVLYNGKSITKVRFVDTKSFSGVKLVGTEDGNSNSTAHYSWRESGVIESEIKWVAQDNAKDLCTWSGNGTELYVTSLPNVSGSTSFKLFYFDEYILTVHVDVVLDEDGSTTVEDSDKKTTEDKDRKTEKTEPKPETTEATTEAPKADYVAQYSYSMHLIQSPGANWTMHTNTEPNGWTNGNTYYIYIKTDNPDPSSFALVSNMGQMNTLDVEDVDTIKRSVEKIWPSGLKETIEMDTFHTASTEKISFTPISHVSGGYAFSIKSATAGDLSIDIYERSSSVANGSGDITDTTQFAKVCTYTNTFVDYPTAYRAEVNRIAGLVKAKYGDKDFETMCKNISTVMRDEGYLNMGGNMYTWTACGILNAKRFTCSTGSDFVAAVCKALGAKNAAAVLENPDTPGYISAHEVVKVEYGSTTFIVSSGFNAMTQGYSEETLNANKPDLSKLN